MKKKADQLTQKQYLQTISMLFDTAKEMQDKQQIETFLNALLTPSEKLMFGRRIWIAKLLLQGKSHSEIGMELEVGTSTILRVNRWLKKQMPEYEKYIQKQRRNTIRSNCDPFSFGALKKRYPMHFLLFNLADEIFRK